MECRHILGNKVEVIVIKHFTSMCQDAVYAIATYGMEGGGYLLFHNVPQLSIILSAVLMGLIHQTLRCSYQDWECSSNSAVKVQSLCPLRLSELGQHPPNRVPDWQGEAHCSSDKEDYSGMACSQSKLRNHRHGSMIAMPRMLLLNRVLLLRTPSSILWTNMPPRQPLAKYPQYAASFGN